MTNKQILEVVQAAENGATIECKNKRLCKFSEKWITLAVPDQQIAWNFAEFDYRVKQEPIHLWLQLCTNLEGESTGLWQEKFSGIGRHFVEVLPDED